MKCNTCGKYGDVHKVKVISTHDVLYICYECDAIWTEEQRGQDSISTVDDYKKTHNLVGKWSELFKEIE